MGLKSFRVECEGNTSFYDEDVAEARKFARNLSKTEECSVFLVFAKADTFIPSEAKYEDKGQIVFGDGRILYREGVKF